MASSSAISWQLQFQTPPAEFRPVPFWSWNEWMQPQEIARQVELMARGGFGGAFIHARVGLLTPYLGPEWFEACAATLQACREHGLIAWLYDEDKWPSGFSGGSVPLANPDFRHKSLIARSTALPAPPDCTPLGEAKAGVQVYRWVSPLGDPWFNGTTYADLLSRDAMRKFLDDAYEPYFERFADDYGSLIVAQFTDEPCSSYRPRLPKGAIPFTDEVFQRFQAMHGYDALPHLPLLFAPGEGAARFRLHYYQAIAELFELNFSAQLGNWCESHHIALTGHYILEGNLYHQKLWGTQIMPHYRHQGIPGIDHLGRQITERITGKQCASVANQYGKKRVLSELYGVAGGGLSFEDRWWIATQQITLGVNLLNPHLALYTMAGCRKRDYPQNMFYQQPWWPLNQAVDEPLSRLCVALSQGRYHAEILVIHPGQSTFVLWEAVPGDGVETIGSDWSPVTPAAEQACQNLDSELQVLTNALLGAQRTFDFADETILRDAGSLKPTKNEAFLSIGEMKYSLVVLPSLETLAATTFELLRGFKSQGGPVVRSGRAPQFLDGEKSSALDAWLESVPFVDVEQLAQELQKMKVPVVEARAGGQEPLDEKDARLLWTHVRDLENGDRLVWLVNLNRNRDFSAEITLRGAWKGARLMDASSGLCPEIAAHINGDGLQLHLPFARTQGHLVHLERACARTTQSGEMVRREKTIEESLARQIRQIRDKNQRNKNQSATALERFENGRFEELVTKNGLLDAFQGEGKNREERDLSLEIPASQWQVSRLDDNSFTLDYARWKGHETWSARAMPVIVIQEMLNRAQYRGPLSLEYAVQVGELKASQKINLVVERPENYRISVNGTAVEATKNEAGQSESWRDIRWISIDISGLLRLGENHITLECPAFEFGDRNETHDQVARYGTEIEAIYLVGDFGVAAQLTGQEPRQAEWDDLELPDVAVRVARRDSLQIVANQTLILGDVTTQGLPFYAGRLLLEMELPRTRGASGLGVSLGHLDGAIAEVSFRGELVGTIWSHPLEIELPAAALEGGTLQITLYGTLRNLLGPHHHSAGELVMVGPDNFLPSSPPEAQGAGYGAWLQSWIRGETAPPDWNDNYCLLAFGEAGSIVLHPR
ncbi:hypothetical protein B1R32_10663 [Abditibacterium utsteinense]|uniref:Alpha-L-rhamnosidase n=2 Tax=Abditibacterium utsteinense TaxID=1960156 RepID=A0A2S8STZ7_9BACT|nr:hypothetical protein B1R32_10663 [Abditibacterium utsteinense]